MPIEKRPEEVVLARPDPPLRRDPMEWTPEQRFQGENLLTVIRLATKTRSGSIEKLMNSKGQLRQVEVKRVLGISRCFQHPTVEETLDDMLDLLRARGHTWKRQGDFLYEQ